MRSMSLWLVLSTVAAPLAAQSLPQPTIPTAGSVLQIRYPAGALAAAPKFRLSPAPIATMGGADAPMDAELTTMNSPHFLADGRVVALDRKELHVAVFDATGRLQKVLGQKGGGPGEYDSPYFQIATAGDTIISGDNSLGKVVLVRASGTLLKEMPFSARARIGMMVPVGMVGSGVAFSPGGFVLVPNDSTHRPNTPVWLLHPSNGVVDTLFSVSGPMMTNIEMTVRGKTIRQTIVVNFSPPDMVAATRNGFVVGRAGPFLLEYRNARGVVERTVSVQGARRPVTAAVKAEWVEGQARRIAATVDESGKLGVPDRKAIEANARFADSLPATGSVVAVGDGSVWVHDYSVSSTSPWGATLLGPDGRILGRLEGKGDATPIAWMRDRVMLQSKDDDGVITWRVYRILGVPQ
jgi:hypothetical protein